jgi:hypothetical protein
MAQLGHDIGRESPYVLRQEKKMCEKYNGWTNRETWATALWLDNEQGTQELMQEMAEQHDSQAGLAESIEGFVTELLDMEEVLSAPPAQRKELISMSSDIGSLYRVNWYEIAEHYLSGIKTETEVA